MAGKKKNYWYVIVMTGEGAVFVTSVDHSTKMAHWNRNEKPLELGEFTAKDLSLGLMCNFTSAFAVCAPIEIDHQPYLYSRGHFEWVANEKEEEE